MSEREVLESLFGRWDPTEGEGLLQRWVERSLLQPKGACCVLGQPASRLHSVVSRGFLKRSAG